MNIERKVMENVFKFMDMKIVDTNKNKIEAYTKFLLERTNLKETRIKSILELNDNKVIRVKELDKIAKALEVHISELFKFED